MTSSSTTPLPELDQEFQAITDELTDAVALTLQRYHGRIPQTREEFVAAVVSHVAQSLQADSFGQVLKGLIVMHAAQERAEAVMHTMALILDRDNPALTAECIAYAAGLHGIQRATLLDGQEIDAPSESQLAYKHGVDRQTVSKRVTECQKALGLRPSRGMKDLEAQDVFAERAHEVHGTDRDPAKDAQKKSRTVIAAIDRICQWARGGEISWIKSLPTDQLDLLRRAFARLRPTCEAIAHMWTEPSPAHDLQRLQSAAHLLREIDPRNSPHIPETAYSLVSDLLSGWITQHQANPAAAC